MHRDKFKKYLCSKLKDLDIDEKYNMLTEIRMATEDVTAELNSHTVYCKSCKKHFFKADCKERIAEVKEFIQDDDHDSSMFPKGTTFKHKILYRICPKCGKDDLHDTIIETTIED